MKTIFLAACIICISITVSQAQETNNIKEKNQSQESLHIKVKDDVKPDIYINDKKYDFEILELLDADKIESMEVIKGEQAIKEYNAQNGVILITAKKETDSSMTINSTGNSKDQSNNSSITIRGTGTNISSTSGSPMIIIDEKVASKEDLEEMSSDDVDNIVVLKGDEAMENYNSESGVIVVTTKKGKKKDKKNK